MAARGVRDGESTDDAVTTDGSDPPGVCIADENRTVIAYGKAAHAEGHLRGEPSVTTFAGRDSRCAPATGEPTDDVVGADFDDCRIGAGTKSLFDVERSIGTYCDGPRLGMTPRTPPAIAPIR